MKDKNHRLNKLLPPKKEKTLGLRIVNTYETIRCKTTCYNPVYGDHKFWTPHWGGGQQVIICLTQLLAPRPI